MGLHKRGRYWHYDFIYRGIRKQGSTGQTNINKAKLVEAKVRSDAALEHFGIAAPKNVPLFKTFMEGKFLDFVRTNAKAKRTLSFYRDNTRRLLEFEPFANAKLSDIDGDLIEQFKAWRLKSVSVISVNRSLATLTKALNLAVEWQLIRRRPKVRRLPGERERTFTVSAELEAAYLAAAPFPLKEAAILLLDLGLRPEECVALRKCDLADAHVTVTSGKTANARRSLPQTERTREAIELLNAVWPESEWLFRGTKGGHLRRGTLDRMHSQLRTAHDWPAEFALYSLRHSFGTRLAESGAGPFDIMQAMGHGSVTISQRYIHLSSEHLTLAMKRKEALDRLTRGEVHEDTPEKSKTS